MRTDGQMDARVDGRRDMAKLIVALLNSANAPNSTQAIGPEPDNRTLSKGTTSTEELLHTDGASAYHRKARATHKIVKVPGIGQEQ
jgi:hypothetical protein